MMVQFIHILKMTSFFAFRLSFFVLLLSSLSLSAKEGKTELEAIAAKGVSVPEPEIEEEHFYHRGR